MPLDLVTVPCLSDNYAFLLHNPDTGDTALFDAPEAGPIRAALADRDWRLTDVILTHHHWDHVDGLGPLRDEFSPRVIGGADDAHRLPPLDLALRQGDALTLCGADVAVFDVSGHTIGHLAFHIPAARMAFTADSLMALGCGRLFEGSPAQMWTSLLKLRDLPGDTLICSGHEYTSSNARFARSIDPDNAALAARADQIGVARAANQPTVPSLLSLERATNPFLRADVPEFQASLGMAGADPALVFAHIRAAKDNF